MQTSESSSRESTSSVASPSTSRLFWIGAAVRSGDLGADQPVTPIDIWPLLSERADIYSISAYCTSEILKMQPSGPYLLGGGVCYSSLVAYETARNLVAGGQDVRLLVMIEPWRPGLDTAPLRLIRRLLLSIYYPYSLVEFAGKMINSSRKRRRHGRQMPCGITEADLRARLFDLFVDKSVENYVARPYNGRIRMIVGAHMKERFLVRAGWRRLAAKGIEIHPVRAASWEELQQNGATAHKVREWIESVTDSGARRQATHQCEGLDRARPHS